MFVLIISRSGLKLGHLGQEVNYFCLQIHWECKYLRMKSLNETRDPDISFFYVFDVSFDLS